MALRGKRYRKPSKAETGEAPLKADKTRRRSALCKCTRWCGMGKTKEDILDMLMEDFGYSEGSAIDIYDNTKNRLKKRYQEYVDQVAEININRLNTMLEECYDSNDRKSVLQTIDMLNKMAGVYVDKKEIKTDGFEIKLEQ